MEWAKIALFRSALADVCKVKCKRHTLRLVTSHVIFGILTCVICQLHEGKMPKNSINIVVNLGRTILGQSENLALKGKKPLSDGRNGGIHLYFQY